MTTTDAPNSDPYDGGSPIIGSAGVSYIAWKGFTINQHNIKYRRGNGIINAWGAYTTIENCIITGEYTTYSTGGDQHNAILAKGVDNGTQLAGLVIRNNRLSGFTGSSGRNDSAITMYWIDSATIENNDIYSNNSGISAKSSDGDSTNVTIRYNLFYSNSIEAINVQSHSYWYVYKNIFRNNGTGFKFFPGIYQTGTDKPRYIYLVNNTFYNNTNHIYWDSSLYINNCHVKNNIFNTSTRVVYGEDTLPANMIPSAIHFNYNVYNTFSNFGIYQESTNFTFATWQSETFGSQDANSANSIDPLFANVSGNDFRLCTGGGTPYTSCSGASPCLEGGANDGVDILDLDEDSATDDAIPLGAYITGSETIGVSNSPSILSISSGKTNDSYKAGEVIDIDVTFSENVTSTGNVTVTLETGDTDRTCTFTVTDSNFGTCNYTVQAGDTSSDLNVSSVAGTIADGDSNAMTNFTPGSNLAANKAIVIDTTVPTLSGLSPSGTIAYTATKVLTLTTSESSTCRFHSTESSWGSMDQMSTTGGTSHNQTVNVNAGTAYTFNVLCQDTATNESAAGQWSFTTLANEPPVTIGSGGSLAIGTGGSINFVLSQ